MYILLNYLTFAPFSFSVAQPYLPSCPTATNSFTLRSLHLSLLSIFRTTTSLIAFIAYLDRNRTLWMRVGLAHCILSLISSFEKFGYIGCASLIALSSGFALVGLFCAFVVGKGVVGKELVAVGQDGR